ncbi:MAG: dUTP diphosphatase [Pygmaiobacter sp.]
MDLTVKVKKLHPGAQLPRRATSGSAAADLYALCGDAGVLLRAQGGRAVLSTGIALELPSAEFVALIFARSGLGIKKGITLANSVGVIDSDYRGELAVGLINLSNEDYLVQNGERIAQLAILPVAAAQFVEVDALGDTLRGEGGLGSTGTR